MDDRVKAEIIGDDIIYRLRRLPRRDKEPALDVGGGGPRPAEAFAGFAHLPTL